MSIQKLQSLKTFFWTVLAFTMVEYLAIALFMASIWKLSPSIDNGTEIFLCFLIFMLLLPSLLLYQAQSVLKNFYPARAFSRWQLGFTVSICIVQIVTSIFLAAFSFYTAMVDLPRETSQIGNDIPIWPSYLCAISMFGASLWNLTAAIVLWRTIWIIRRNYRTRLWESFEVT
jgi:hypothetical protein